jgi:hypothetical protein
MRVKQAPNPWPKKFPTCPLLLGFLLAALALPGCSKGGKEEPGKTEPAKTEKKEESRVQHGTNGEITIKLDAETQKTMGLQVAPLQPMQLSPELKVYGRVLDSSGLVTAAADLTATQAASEVSQAELQRLKTLAGQNNASARSVQAAEAAAIRDRGQADSARLKLVAMWGAAIADRKDLQQLAESLGTMNAVLVQLNVPAGETVKATPRTARVFTLNEETNSVAAQFVSTAPTVDPQLQTQSFLFLVNSNSQHLAPGAALSGFLELPGESQSGSVVPGSAVLRFNGARWVYLQTGDETFTRVELASDESVGNGWFVRSGLKPGQKVVVAGAQEILSEELKD